MGTAGSTASFRDRFGRLRNLNKWAPMSLPRNTPFLTPRNEPVIRRSRRACDRPPATRMGGRFRPARRGALKETAWVVDRRGRKSAGVSSSEGAGWPSMNAGTTPAPRSQPRERWWTPTMTWSCCVVACRRAIASIAQSCSATNAEPWKSHRRAPHAGPSPPLRRLGRIISESPGSP